MLKVIHFPKPQLHSFALKLQWQKERNIILINGTRYNIEIFIISKNNIISAKVDINLKAK